jgi:hypothetical protein
VKGHFGMAKTLKVFRAHLGFYDTIVAAPSQKAALEAWGMHINAFADGAAGVTTEKDAVEAALARPGVVLKRPFGSKARFKEDPDRIPAPLIKAEANAHSAVAKRREEQRNAKDEERARETARREAQIAKRERERSEKKEKAERLAREAAEREIAAAKDARRKALDALDERENELRRKRETIEREAEARIRKAEARMRR